jgi:hypothetical protein
VSNIPFESFINSHSTLVAEQRSMPTTTHGFGRCLAMAIFLFIHATFTRQMALIARES